MTAAVTAMGLALALVTLVAFKYKAHLEAQLARATADRDRYLEVIGRKNAYIRKLETKMVESAGPDELAGVLSRVFDPDGDPDREVPSGASS